MTMPDGVTIIHYQITMGSGGGHAPYWLGYVGQQRDGKWAAWDSYPSEVIGSGATPQEALGDLFIKAFGKRIDAVPDMRGKLDKFPPEKSYAAIGWTNVEEPPLCILCDTTPMEETETGYICPNCRASTDWNEDKGEWIEKPPKRLGLVERWEIAQNVKRNK